MNGTQIASTGIIFTPSLIKISQLVQRLDGQSQCLSVWLSVCLSLSLSLSLPPPPPPPLSLSLSHTHTQHSDLKCSIFFSAVHVHVFVQRHITPMAMCAAPNFRDNATTPDEVTYCRILKCVTVLLIPHNSAKT
jgi:hypothetical protein